MLIVEIAELEAQIDLYQVMLDTCDELLETNPPHPGSIIRQREEVVRKIRQWEAEKKEKEAELNRLSGTRH